jgi:ATP-dependent DNA helicase RecG
LSVTLYGVFDDRLEVSNPGGLQPGLTVEDLRRSHESRPRNKLVADAFFLIKYIEQFGTGVHRMLNDCRETGVPEPDFESRRDTFRIVFRRAVSLEERLAAFKLNQTCNSSEARSVALLPPGFDACADLAGG